MARTKPRKSLTRPTGPRTQISTPSSTTNTKTKTATKSTISGTKAKSRSKSETALSKSKRANKTPTLKKIDQRYTEGETLPTPNSLEPDVGVGVDPGVQEEDEDMQEEEVWTTSGSGP